MRRLVLAAGLIAAGCSSTPPPPPSEVESAGIPNPEVAVQRALSRAALTTADLYRTRAGERPVVPEELQRPLAWTFTGPLDEAGRQMAQHAGYEFVAPDPGPALPVVRVNTQAMPMVDILRLLGEQAGDKATISVNPRRRVIQVFRP